jgi:phosphohistidine swiveling domain-containing protein
MAWFLMQSIEHAHLHAWIEPMRNAGCLTVPRLGQPTDSLLAFNGAECELHFDLNQWTKRGEVVMREVMANPGWLREVVHNSAIAVFQLRKIIETLVSRDYEIAKGEALTSMVCDFFTALRTCHLAGLPIVILETRHELWTNYVRELLESAMRRSGMSAEELPSVFSTLSTPDRPSTRVREKLSRGKLYELVRRNKDFASVVKAGSRPSTVIAREFPKIDAALAKHTERFWWIPYMYQGPGWDKDHFVRELTTMIESDANPQQLRDRIRQSSRERKNLERSLHLSAEEQSILALTRQLMYVKDARKDATYFAFAKSEGFWRTVADRLDRPLNLIRMLLPEEVTTALTIGADVPPNEAALNDRFESSCVEYSSGQERLLVGRSAAQTLSRVISEEENAVGDSEVFKGTCAVPGRAVGIVKIVNSPEEGRDMRDGQILVSVATDPSLEAAMLRAAAIVTDMGGITCHAAIVSRELGTPCVVGTRFASKVLNDGEMVEVDATNGLVRKIPS